MSKAAGTDGPRVKRVRPQWADQQGEGASFGPGQGEHSARHARLTECGLTGLPDEVPQLAVFLGIGGTQAALVAGEPEPGTQQPLSQRIGEQ